jgi:hypothetical protein
MSCIPTKLFVKSQKITETLKFKIHVTYVISTVGRSFDLISQSEFLQFGYIFKSKKTVIPLLNIILVLTESNIDKFSIRKALIWKRMRETEIKEDHWIFCLYFFN